MNQVIDDLIAEDNWQAGITCENCGSLEWNILTRFRKYRIMCAHCDTELVGVIPESGFKFD
jgi:hypothetical protein